VLVVLPASLLAASHPADVLIAAVAVVPLKQAADVPTLVVLADVQ
jgi:hypothetical protein